MRAEHLRSMSGQLGLELLKQMTAILKLTKSTYSWRSPYPYTSQLLLLFSLLAAGNRDHRYGSFITALMTASKTHSAIPYYPTTIQQSTSTH